VNQRNWLAIAAVILGIILVIVGIVYWIEPASSLPGFFPGHDAGSSEHHIKHGIAAFVVGLALFVFAWFSLGKKKSAA
jgi:uncharacterized membrane-anchored protein YitT (DUF2179 family)